MLMLVLQKDVLFHYNIHPNFVSSRTKKKHFKNKNKNKKAIKMTDRLLTSDSKTVINYCLGKMSRFIGRKIIV
jgi:hypothetical protein